MAWGMGGWLLFPFLQRMGAGGSAARLRAACGGRAHHHVRQPLLRKKSRWREALQPAEIAVYGQRATGTKYLLNPNKA
jgi:NADPH2:quinone reductase